LRSVKIPENPFANISININNRSIIQGEMGKIWRQKRRRVLSQDRVWNKKSEFESTENQKRWEIVHKTMVHMISAKLKHSKYVNGRFFSPQKLQQKAFDYQM